MLPIDYAPLTAPVSPDEVRAFRATHRGSPPYAGASSGVAAVVIVFFVVAGGIVISTFISIVAQFARTAQSNPSFFLTTLVVPIVFVGVFIVIAVVVVRSIWGGGNWARWLRLSRFAEANGLIFSPASPDPAYPGAVFTTGRSRAALDHLRTSSGRFLDYGNFRFVTGSGRSSTTHNWGFLALSLDRTLPHMVLDSRANNGLFGGTNLPASFTKSQVLELEGDFNSYFTLHCPREYERDALYVFTPDLMALLIDEAAPFDVEIIDTWMFVYAAHPFDLQQPTVHQRLWRIADTVGKKTLSQTERYADERVGDFSANIVAPQGRRLTRSIPAITLIIGIAALLFWGIPLIADVIGTLVGLFGR